MPKCRPQTRFIPATFAWAILLAATSLFFCYPCLYLYKKYFLIIPVYEGIVTLFVLANFSLATFMDPGIIPKASPDEDRDDDFRAPLYKNVEINGITVRMKWCVTCQFYRPPRCSHCSVCNHCIETFDHHCPWVNNCIGRRNYRFFFMFLVSLSIHMVSIFCFCLIFVLDHYDQLKEAATIISMVIMGVITVLFIPIIGLTGFHVVLVSRGRTTNEQVTGKFRGGYNPFSQGCWRNCCLALCGPLFPSLSKPSKSLLNKPKKYSLTKGQQTSTTTQLKVYMDNSNGVRVPHQNSYSKMSPGHDIQLEAAHSQSQDCEPSPPVIRHGSKTNFFIESENHNEKIVPRKGSLKNHHYTRGSPHPKHRSDGIRSQTSDPLSPEHQPSGIRSPTMQQRMRAIGGVPTPLAMSSPIRRSNPGTPNQPRRQDYKPTVNMTNQWQNPDGDGANDEPSQRKFPSEGELRRQIIENQPQANSTIDNIPELARSPQKGQYSWREHQSPPVRPFQSGYRSNPTSPTQQPTVVTGNPPQYAASYNIPPVYRGGQSPQVRRKNYSYAVSPTDPQQYNRPNSNPAPRRPVSFVRALEMTDGMELSGRTSHIAVNNTHLNSKLNNEHSIMSPPRDIDRKSVYDINYEISV